MTEAQRGVVHLIEPRGLRREQAARYVGVSPTKFDELVKDGRMPTARRVDGCVIWDRRALDSAFDDLPTEAAANEWDLHLGKSRA